MKITLERYNLIKSKLQQIITKKGIDWKDIGTEIKKVTTVKNWLVVRGVLQDLINEGVVSRTNDIMKETYTSNK